MRALVLNDTRREPCLRHLGCHAVMTNLLALCASRGIEILAAFAAPDAALHPDFHRLLPRADAVLVNGEGTMHHDSASALQLAHALSLAQNTGKLTALLNTAWLENPAASACLPRLDLAHARDPRSAERLRADGAPLVLEAPDLSLYPGPAPALPHSSPPPAFAPNLLVHDSVRPALTHRLHAYAQRHALPFRVLQNWTARADLASPAIARARFLASSEICPETVLLGGRFHAACFALRHGAPFLALPSNTDKIEALLEQADLPADDFVLPENWDSHTPEHWLAQARAAASRHAFAIARFRSAAAPAIERVFDTLHALHAARSRLAATG